jgi:prepilin-type N-terminal cleavage/methylation domain-containing protein
VARGVAKRCGGTAQREGTAQHGGMAQRGGTARRNAQRGFSLLELLIVAAVIGCLCVVAVPVYAGQRAKAENVLLTANARNLQPAVQGGWLDVQNAGPTSLTGGIIVARQWLARQLQGGAQAGGGLHLVNPCTGSDRIVDSDKLPHGLQSPAVWLTSAQAFDHEQLVASNVTAARLRGTIIVDFVVDSQQRSGQIEIFSIDRNGQKSTAVQTVPLAD